MKVITKPFINCPKKPVKGIRAIASLMEELEAVDWYNQRVDA